ncbi:MAG: outer membrane beta-barrel protein [Hyphomicrobiaceae bacterium]|nr:outer membrane beta-barrel protein [Hyphomicrobiaceae bacterium]
MRLATATLAICLASGLSAPALADGMPRQRTAPAVGPYAYPAPEQSFFNWSGLYIGGHIGGLNAQDRGTFDSGTAVPYSTQDAAFVGGGHVGLHYQIRQLVLGVEYSYSALSTTLGANLSTGYTVTTKLKDVQIVSGKIGYAYQNYLFYGKGGYAMSQLDLAATDGSTLATGSGRGSGWMAGIGISYAITPRIIIGAEYDYIKLSADSSTLGASSLTGHNIDAQMGALRLDLKF